MLVKPPHRPRWLPDFARRGYLNQDRDRLAVTHGTRSWTYKGVLTRIFGQGIQGIFKDLPASAKAAITGSMGVAVYDMMTNKRDLNWMPNDVDVFVAIPRHHRKKPLRKMYPIMSKWLRSVQAQGFLYELNRACYSKAMCVFDYKCTNAKAFPDLHLPKISFIGHPASSVREICNGFDIPICGPILCRRTRKSPIRTNVTAEISHLFQTRTFYSNTTPTTRTLNGRRTYQRIVKYVGREFTYFPTDRPYRRRLRTASGRFPRFPTRIYQSRRRVCKRFIITTLGREPTKQERLDFNIAD